MIVNTASIAGKQPQGWLAAYSATKAGVIALTEATAKEIANDGVRCTSICPGFVDTPMTEWIRGQVAQADMIRPEDVAEVVRCLLRLSPACMIPEVMMIRPADLTSRPGPRATRGRDLRSRSRSGSGSRLLAERVAHGVAVAVPAPERAEPARRALAARRRGRVGPQRLRAAARPRPRCSPRAGW